MNSKFEAIRKILESERGTGQTTSVLFAAARRRMQTNSTVFIIGANANHCRELQRQALEIFSEVLVAGMQFSSWDGIPKYVKEEDTFYDHFSLQGEILRMVALVSQHSGAPARPVKFVEVKL